MRDLRLKNPQSYSHYVALLSGGIDSAMASHLVAASSRAMIWPLYIRRGAAAEPHELRAASAIVTWLRQQHGMRCAALEVVDCIYPPRSLKERLSSELRDRHGYPGREVMLASVAVMYSLCLGHAQGEVAVVGGSLAQDLFAHNSPDFLSRLNGLLVAELGEDAVPVLAPLQVPDFGGPYDKGGVIRLARMHSFPLEIARSCVSGNDIPCGACLECRQRSRAEMES